MDAAQYDIHADVEDRHWWWRARREIIAAAIRRFRPRGDPLQIAEIGCASGGNLAMLESFGTVLGAEMETAALDHLKRKHGDRFQTIHHRIPEPLPHRVDVLGLFDVLEHVADDRGALRWAAAQLTPGGIAVITVPAFRFLWSDQDEAVHHHRRYTSQSLAAAVPPELEIIHLTGFNALLFAPILAARWAMRIFRHHATAPRSHLGIPPALINWLLTRIFRMERHWIARLQIPFGVSLLMIARRIERNA